MKIPNETYPLISVIVPIYNVEPYLRECVESILAQTYNNLEILLVDDGSPDSCGQICDEYELKDARVVSLHKKNGGLSDARNYGLKHAHGEWISFIDSDDYVSSAFIETLYDAATAYECAIAAVPGGKKFNDGDACDLVDSIHLSIPKKYLDNDSEDNHLQLTDTALLSAHDALERMLYQKIATGAPWRLYRRDVLGEDPFPVGLYYEDLASTYKFVQRAKEIVLLNNSEMYAYRLRLDSIIRQSYSPLKSKSATIVSRQLYRDIITWYPDLRAAVSSRCFSVLRMVYAQMTNNIDDGTNNVDGDKMQIWNEINNYKTTVFYDTAARKRERFAAGIAIMGQKPFTIFCILCRKIGLMR